MANPNELPARGKLKIFLGYAAGVGKTYAMLEAAHQYLAAGQDLVVACLETRGQPETEALLPGLELISGRQAAPPTELDLDAVLARRPQIALVDELAHTNTPGARHAKRYQDVLELLDAGIDVHTTLNVQHLESLNDVVAQITGVTIRETVPDKVLDNAAEIELIDLPIGELAQRLSEGKVRVPGLTTPAVEKFFRPGNLSALRELALRRAADRIDEQMRAYMQTHAITGPWPTTDRLLVCVSPSPLSERLVRATRRMAVRRNAEWFAVYIETPGRARLSPADSNRVARNLQLAELLGAKTVTLTGNSVAEAIVAFARSRNITTIVAGKPLRPRWVELWRGSIVDQIIRRSGDLDVYVISNLPEQSPPPVDRGVTPPINYWLQYAQSIGLVALVTLLTLPLRPLIEPTNMVMFSLLTVVIVALRFGRRPAVLTSFLCVIVFDFVFVPPYHTFAVSDAQYLLTFAALLGVGLIISTLAAQAHEQAKAAQSRAAQTVTMYELSRDLTAVEVLTDIVRVVVLHINQIFHRQVVVFLPANGKLEPVANRHGFGANETEQNVAAWVYQHGQPAGRGTDTLAGAAGTYLPLKSAQQVVGVLGIELVEENSPLTPEQWRLLEAFASQAAQAIERVQLAGEARQTQLLRETEKLQTALLNSISHDLRTPLASVTGALSSLRHDAAFLDDAARAELVSTAWEQADRLNNLVGNLLEMTRLEAGAIKIKPELSDVQEVVGVALGRLGHRLDNHPVELEVPDALPPVWLDLVLVAQVLVNLLDNAVKYSPAGRPITIKAEIAGPDLLITVTDRGAGIPAEDLTRIFEKFYRGPGTEAVTGTGLGLSICKGIVEVLGGRIWAGNRAGGGAAFYVALPIGGQHG